MFRRKNDFGEIKNDLKEIKEKINSLSINPTVSTPLSSNDIGNVIKEWEIVINTQMHFNDLLMKLRTATLSIVLAIFGAAGYSQLILKPII